MGNHLTYSTWEILPNHSLLKLHTTHGTSIRDDWWQTFRRFQWFTVKSILIITQLTSILVITLTLSQWSSSGNPVCLELRPQCTLECHWRTASVLPVVFQWCSSGFPVVFQCVPIIMQINTGSPLGHHWVLASASVVPVASQCTCGSSGLPVCSNYAN